MSSIPAGALIVSATLDLVEHSCIGACANPTSEVFTANSNVGSATDGLDLAGAASPEGSAGTGGNLEFDVTNAVQAWVGGLANDGLVFETADEPTGTSGTNYYSPSASNPIVDRPSMSVVYVAPTVPDAPTQLSVVPGDGGAIISWAPPSNQGEASVLDSPITNFTVEAFDSSHSLVSTVSTDTNSVLMTGLNDGQAYTFEISATNAVGTGAVAVSSIVIPVATTGGTADYIAAVEQYLQAQNALMDGQESSPSAAMSGDSEASMFSGALNAEASWDEQSVTTMTATDMSYSLDSLTFSDILVSQSSSSSVDVYLKADLQETTTVDVGLEDETAQAGEMILPYRLSFDSGVLYSEVDADYAILPVLADSERTAHSDALDPAPSPGPSYATTLGAGVDATPSDSIDLGATADWAYAHWNHRNDPGYPNSSADFGSDAMQRGGGLHEYMPATPGGGQCDDVHWYYNWWDAWTTCTWWTPVEQGATLLNDGGFAYKYASNMIRGEEMYINESGAGCHPLTNSCFGNINHMGVITSKRDGVPFVSQHATDIKSIAVYGVPHSWLGRWPKGVLYGIRPPAELG